MSTSTLHVVYMMGYVALVWILPLRKIQNGYFWRGVRKLLPGRWGSRDPIVVVVRHLVSYFGWYGVCLFVLPDPWFEAVFFPALIVIGLDDLYNGDDDDRKRRWESLKNKVKWLWLPSERELQPIRVPS